MVYNLALQYVQNIEDAEEITQDVFMAVYRSLSAFREDSSYSTWIYQITINKSLDFIKAKKRKKRFGFLTSLFSEDQIGDLNTPVEFNHPGVQMEDKESLKRLFEYINSLPDNQKTALILHKIENLPQVEVARIMELSPKAVESLIQRAKTGLAKKINTTEG
jgi:RNA polymerase sigma factor (sigma-70 family)